MVDMNRSPEFIIEEVTDPQEIARHRAQDARHKRNLVRWRAQLAGRIPMGRQTPEGLQAKIRQTLIARAQIPSVHSRRMISLWVTSGSNWMISALVKPR